MKHADGVREVLYLVVPEGFDDEDYLYEIEPSVKDMPTIALMPTIILEDSDGWKSLSERIDKVDDDLLRVKYKDRLSLVDSETMADAMKKHKLVAGEDVLLRAADFQRFGDSCEADYVMLVRVMDTGQVDDSLSGQSAGIAEVQCWLYDVNARGYLVRKLHAIHSIAGSERGSELRLRAVSEIISFAFEDILKKFRLRD